MTIVWVRSTHAPDSRFLKYRNAAEACGLRIHVVRWNRSGRAQNDGLLSEFGLAAEIGGGWRNLVALLRWNLYVARMLLQLRRKATVIHAVDLDAILPCLLIGKLLHKKVVFEMYDEYADARDLSMPVTRWVKAIERRCAYAADAVILADSSRFAQLGLPEIPTAVVVENVPASVGVIDCKHFLDGGMDGCRLRLVYVGVLQSQCRGIEDLLDVVSKDQTVFLEIAGAGPLEALCRRSAGAYANIRYHGPLEYDQALKLMGTADILVGLYYANNRNHTYAAPNKYFEHLLLGKALLTSANTPPGRRVQAADTGWAIEDGPHSLAAWLRSATRVAAVAKGAHAHAQWLEKYRDYDKSVVQPLYRRLIAGSSH